VNFCLNKVLFRENQFDNIISGILFRAVTTINV
jgi:hypothetical protein